MGSATVILNQEGISMVSLNHFMRKTALFLLFLDFSPVSTKEDFCAWRIYLFSLSISSALIRRT